MSENEIKSSFIACKIHFKVQFFRQMWLGRTNVFTTIPIWFKSHFVQIFMGFLWIGVVAAYLAYNQKIVGSNPGGALLIPEVNVVDIQLKALLGLCSLLVQSALCAGNRM